MFAYVIGENGARKLLKKTNDVPRPIDDIVLGTNEINDVKINAYVARKKFCSVVFSNSEIKKMGRPF
jgi:hypothetical protein